MRYTLQRTRVDEVRRLCEKFRLDFLDANIFARRGISKADDIRFYLEGGVNNLRSPFLFDDMEEAVERILSAQEEGETIAIFGDRDADGITSTALLCQELEAMGLEVKCHLPEGDEPYGLSMKAVDEIREEGARLVITVDNGITCLEEVDRLNGYGIDTIVVDHHLAGDELPDALAILDPKAPDSGYPFEHLAGCAVTAKLVWALRFAQTPLYKSHVILLHAEPGPGDVEKSTTVVQAVELYNLVEVERIVEALPNRAVDFDNSRLVRLLMRGLPILVLDSQDELRQLTLAFGPSVDINLVDIRRELEAVIPRTRGKKLFTLATESRAALYADGHEEIETLLSLFTSSCIYKYPQLSRHYADILDLVAIGTIADMMPLVDENRILVRLGLKALSSSKRENLVQLMSAQNLLGHPLTSHDVGWYLSPVVNAAGRLGCPSVALRLLLTKDAKEMYELTVRLIELNKERQKMGEEAWEDSWKAARDSLESYGSKFLCLDTGRTPRGLTGALASRALKEFTATPAVMVLSQEDEGRISGSMRSRGSFNCRDFLSKFSDKLIDFGGHKAAGGFSMEAGRKADFLKSLEDEVMAMDSEETEEDVLIDALVGEADMGANLIRVVELFEPYGEANGPLTFQYNGALVRDIINLGDSSKGHVKLMLQTGRSLWGALWWGAKKDPSFDYAPGDVVDIVFRVGHNWYKGVDNVQLTLLEVRKAPSTSSGQDR